MAKGKKGRAREARGGDQDRDSEQDIARIVRIIGGFMALGVAIIFPYMLFGSGGTVSHVDLEGASPDYLKTIFFGGEPWLFVCTTKHNAPPALDKFVTASSSLSRIGVTVATIRCGGELPSGKRVMDRFKLAPPIKRAAFLCANGKKCSQLPKAAMESSDSIVRWVNPRASLQLYEPATPEQFGRACTSRKLCVVAVKDGAFTDGETGVLRKAATAKRTVPFVMVDATARTFSLRKKLPRNDPGPHVVLLRGGGRNVSASLVKDPFGLSTLKLALEAAGLNETEFKPLKKRPTLSSRKPKPARRGRPQSQTKRSPSPPPTKPRRAGRDKPRRASTKGAAPPPGAVKGEGLVSDEERERRRHMDDEMAAMFEPIDDTELGDESTDGADDADFADEDSYYEVVDEEEVLDDGDDEDTGGAEDGEIVQDTAVDEDEDDI